MSLIIKGSKGEYYRPPAKAYNAVCVDAYDIGLVKTQWGEKEKIKLVFQTEDVCPETRVPYIIGKKFTKSLADRADLKKTLDLWRGVAITETEVRAGYDIEKVIGAMATIHVLHQMGQDGLYAYIAAIMPPERGAEKLKPAGYIRWKDRPENQKQAPAAVTGPVNDEEVPF